MSQWQSCLSCDCLVATFWKVICQSVVSRIHFTHYRNRHIRLVSVDSFHVGSGCYDATAFSGAVASAHSVFQVADKIGFHVDLLDIGGGFPDHWSGKITFKEVS